MPIDLSAGAPIVLIRRSAFERAGLSRASLDERLNLTPDEFRVEEGLIVIGPLVGETSAGDLTDALEGAGLAYFDDFFDLSGNWPQWLTLFARARFER